MQLHGSMYESKGKQSPAWKVQPGSQLCCCLIAELSI